MDKEIVLEDKDGNEVVCEVISRWNDGTNTYVAYTDGSMNGEELNTYISKIVDNHLVDITNDDEWKKAKEFLVNFLKDDEDEV